MICLKVMCPRCKKTKLWLSHKVKKREDVFGKTTLCYYCGKGFVIKSNTLDRIVEEINYDPNK